MRCKAHQSRATAVWTELRKIRNELKTETKKTKHPFIKIHYHRNVLWKNGKPYTEFQIQAQLELNQILTTLTNISIQHVKD